MALPLKKNLWSCLLLVVLGTIPTLAHPATVLKTTPIHQTAGGGRLTVHQTVRLSRYQKDAITTNTPDWKCVGFNESRNQYTAPHGGRWQLQGTATLEWLAKTLGITAPPQDYSSRLQNRAALALYRYGLTIWPSEPFHAWRADWSVCHLR